MTVIRCCARSPTSITQNWLPGRRVRTTPSDILTWAAILHVHRRDVAKAREAVELTLAFAAEHEFPFWHTRAVLMQGRVLVQRDMVAPGIERLREGLAGLQAMGSAMIQPWAMGLPAEAYAKASDGARRT
jgi:predicted ATPase